MWIVEFRNYKQFLKARLKDFPKQGRGQLRRLAEHIGVAPIIVSQIISGDRDFNADQAILVAEFFSMDERTTEYFLLQVSHARASTKKLRNYYESKMNLLKAESEDIKNLVIPAREIREEDKIEFYSNWYYAGIWSLTAIEGYQTVETIADYFGIDRTKVSKVIKLLLKTGLCVEEHGKIKVGQKTIFLDKENFQINNHRRAWRDKAIHRLTAESDDEVFYSCPVSISKTDAEKFRKTLLELIKNFSRDVGPSSSEVLFCLNVDWFKF